MYRVYKDIHFCYGHRLLDYDGKCAHPHGHNGNDTQRYEPARHQPVAANLAKPVDQHRGYGGQHKPQRDDEGNGNSRTRHILTQPSEI